MALRPCVSLRDSTCHGGGPRACAIVEIFGGHATHESFFVRAVVGLELSTSKQ